MRTRPWLFPAIAALFVLLLGLAALGLLWGTLAGAATALSDGVVTTDRQFVSPDSTNIASVDRTVGVTLTNLDLNIPLYVGTGPDGQASDFDLDNNGELDRDDVVIVTLNQFVFQGTTFTVRLDDGLSPEGIDYRIIAVSGALSTADITPLASSDGIGAPSPSDIRVVSMDDGIVRADAPSAGVDIGPDEVTVTDIVDVSAGRIQFTIAYASAQETPLVNIKGDATNFDLLLVEDREAPGVSTTAASSSPTPPSLIWVPATAFATPSPTRSTTSPRGSAATYCLRMSCTPPARTSRLLAAARPST